MDAASLAYFEPPGDAKAEPLRRLLTELGRAVDALCDQQRSVEEQQTRMQEVKAEWQAAWGVALAALAKREAHLLDREVEIAEREQALWPAEAQLQARSERVQRREQALECRAARLTRRIVAARVEQERRVAQLVALRTTLRTRAVSLARFQARWERERQVELERFRTLQAACEREQEEAQERSSALQRKLLSLARCEKALDERAFVVAQAEHQLMAHDPNPLAARAVLEQRLEALQNVVERPLRYLDTERKRVEQSRQNLERARAKLREEQNQVDRQRARLQDLGRTLEKAHVEQGIEKVRGQKRSHGLQREHERLRAQVRDLEQQIERLTLLFLESPAVELRAAA